MEKNPMHPDYKVSFPMYDKFGKLCGVWFDWLVTNITIKINKQSHKNKET